MLTARERKFLQSLSKKSADNRVLNPYAKKEALAVIDSLIKRGYIILEKGLTGPLAVDAGEKVITLTEAGKAVIRV